MEVSLEENGKIVGQSDMSILPGPGQVIEVGPGQWHQGDKNIFRVVSTVFVIVGPSGIAEPYVRLVVEKLRSE